MVRSLNRSVILSVLSTITMIRIHPGSSLVTIYYWYFPSFVLRSIYLESYELIEEEYIFAFTDMFWVAVALDTAVSMTPVRVMTRAARIVGSIMAVSFALLSPTLSFSCLLEAWVTLILSYL